MSELRWFESIASHLDHPLVLVGFGLLLVFGIYRTLLRSKKVPALSPRAGARVVHQVLRYGFAIAIVLMALGFGLRAWEIAQTPQVYRVHITVLDPNGMAIDNAKLTSSVGGNWQKGNGYSVLVVPAAVLPADREVTIRATKAPAEGVEAIALTEDFQPTLIVRLVVAPAPVRGYVVDAANRAIPGVRVTVDPAGDAMTTEEDGRFELTTPAGDGEWVRLRAERKGYRTQEPMVMAGKHPVRLKLEAESPR